MKNIKWITGALLLVLFSTSLVFSKNYTGPRKQSKSGNAVAALCAPGSAMTDLDYNNVRATILNGGDMWWDLSNAQYEIPKGSGKTALFAGAIWIGGVDVNGQLRICAQLHRDGGDKNDYWPGPLEKSGDNIANVDAEVCTMYDRHFKINKSDVQKFVAWYNASAQEKADLYAGYSVPEIIYNWPAHGPTAYGEYDSYLAPYVDVPPLGDYDPNSGDYPYYPLSGLPDCNTKPESHQDNLTNTTNYLRGDQTLWWVYNDRGNVHQITVGAEPIGVEIRAQAFAFSTNDELNNMSFYNYEIINRSTYKLMDNYFGVWTDADLGQYDDDYVGCDVNRGLGYLYNGDDMDGDGNGRTYGAQPPAVGMDFFEGPYQDPDYADNLSSWGPNGLDCAGGYRVNASGDKVFVGTSDINNLGEVVYSSIMKNGNINGLNFGDGIPDNERWGMRRFVYFNLEGNAAMTDPQNAIDYYNYLLGIWKDNKPIVYGGTGWTASGSGTRAEFMFPYDSDPCGWGTNGLPQSPWSETLEGNPKGDRRLVQSAGPFTLLPGAVNYITLGVVWAKASVGGAWASAKEVMRADDKAQKLFEACFQLIDGPDSPELSIVEMDNKFIVHIWNKSGSNNYLEQYNAVDPFIPEDVAEKDRYFKFQGYQVFQLKNKDITVNEINNLDVSRLVFQCDVKDGVSQIVNYTWREEWQANIPSVEVQGADQGITHTFTIVEDMFATEAKRLVNHKEYYYLAIAYAHNDFKHYDPTSMGSVGTQQQPYKAGRKGADGAIKVYTATPHPINQLNNGTILNSQYGDTPQITQLEGHGNGENLLILTSETLENILSKTHPPFKADKIEYQAGFGPIQVKVVDPINVPNADFILKMSSDSIHKVDNYWISTPAPGANYLVSNGLIYDTKWTLYKVNESGEYIDSAGAESWIRLSNERLIPQWGISVTIAQVDVPDMLFGKFNELTPANGGILASGMSLEDETQSWLGFLPDQENPSPLNWIRSGTVTNGDGQTGADDWRGRDPDQNHERILGGGWAPYVSTSRYTYGPAFAGSGLNSLELAKYRLSSVIVTITKNRDLWTRCPVFEMCENDDESGTVNSLSEGGALKLDLRKAPSIDKNGNKAPIGALDDTINVDAPNFIGATGMSWFPGYAIDIETGERLNMAFGEDSWLIGDNGRDMLFNPSAWVFDVLYQATGGAAGSVLMGGKHFIYVFGHNTYNGVVGMPGYDFGRYIYEELKTGIIGKKREIFRHPMWVGLPISLGENFEFSGNYDNMPDNDITIYLGVANPYRKTIVDRAVENPENNNFPMYKFSLKEFSATTNNAKTLKNSLDKINVVPNPYYAYSKYEKNQLDNIVKITNLPDKCTITIFNVNGTKIRRIKKDNDQAFVDWDLKNDYGILIAGGVYIIHVDVPGAGEKILKWFGALRPIDLNNF